jgi:Transposase Tn5 dimerisation domain/Transposase DNA-binding
MYSQVLGSLEVSVTLRAESRCTLSCWPLLAVSAFSWPRHYLIMQSWINDELATTNFGDRRLDVRYRTLLDRITRKPSLKFTAACRGPAEVKAAYRFVNNDRVAAAKVLQPHHHATVERIRQQPVVILAQDTSEFDLTRKTERVRGGGPLNDDQRWGFFCHPLLALTPQRLPLGTVHATIWARDPVQFAKPRQQKAAERRAKLIQDKESKRWLEGYRQACAVATDCPQTQVVCVSDSEGDIYECLAEGQQPAAVAPEAQPARRADWIVRACQDRALVGTDQEALAPLFATVASGPVLTQLTIEVSKREPKSKDGRKRKQARSARQALVTVQASAVTLRGPQRPRVGKLADVTVNAILIREQAPPAGEEAIEWLLLTSLPIANVEQVLQAVEYYCCRWQIEIYFRVVKSGCQVETSQLEDGEAYQAYLALYLVVAWRVLYVMMLGRECPEMSCEGVLEKEEWQAVYAVVKRETPPAAPPALGEMVKLIAALGGYLGRRGDGPPGPKAMWLGMQRMTDLTLGWEAFAALEARSTG